jgi:hypothetical protein
MSGVLSDKYTVPPFSILDATKIDWQERKQRWMALGIQSELGRDENIQNFSKTIFRKAAAPAFLILCFVSLRTDGLRHQEDRLSIPLLAAAYAAS